MTGPTKAMSVFEHYVAACSISHMKAIRAAREGRITEAATLNVALFHRMHRLAELAKELGPEALFAPPARPLSPDEVRRMFPD
jgi:transposase